MICSFNDVEAQLQRTTQTNVQRLGLSCPPAGCAAYTQRLFGREGHTFLVCGTSAGGRAVAELHRLEWDSKIYGREMGFLGCFAAEPGTSLELRKQLAEEVRDVILGSGFQMVVARGELDDLAGIQALEEVGFRTMDVQASFLLRISGAATARRNDVKVEVRSYTSADLPRLRRLAPHAFARSHLYADPRLDIDVTNELHSRWIENDCTGRAAFVMIAEVKDEIAGFAAGLWSEEEEKLLGIGHGHIDLIAVDESWQRKGIASALLDASLNEYARRRAEVVTVSTQATNLAAVQLYLKNGFSLSYFALTLHGWFA